MGDDFSNLTDVITDIVGPQIRPRRHHHVMRRLIHPYNTSSGPLKALGQNGWPCLSHNGSIGRREYAQILDQNEPQNIPNTLDNIKPWPGMASARRAHNV